MLLALLLMAATPVNVDKLTPTDLAKVSRAGKTEKFSNLVHDTMKTMYSDAQNGEFCSTFFFHSTIEANFVRIQMLNRYFNVTDGGDDQKFIKVCWGIDK